MNAAFYARRSVVILLVAAVLLATLVPASAGLPAAVLTLLWFFIAILVSFPALRIDEELGYLLYSALPLVSPRPPPVR